MNSNFTTRVNANEDGVTLLTVLLIMVIMAVIGIAGIAVTGLENRIAGFLRTGESAATAAESCLGTAVNIIQQTMDLGSVPNPFLSTAAPVGPVPATNQLTLSQEIMGQSDNNPDDVNAVPNTTMTVNGFAVNGDIDRLYAKPKAGGSLQFASGYEGTAAGAAGGGVDIFYRINCVARNTATNTTSQISAVYACTVTGETCQKKL
ncbi:MAG: pilus assembly PilX family protein [Nitrospiraceae bacterium]